LKISFSLVSCAALARFDSSRCNGCGTRSRADLLAHTLDLAERGGLQTSGPDGRIEGRDKLIAALPLATDRCLRSLLRLGLLKGD
jgi:hypothetical protein